MARGRHRARPDRQVGRILICALVAALAVGAATMSAVATDDRALRGATFVGLLAVLAMALLLAVSPTGSSAADEDERRRLRREIAELRGEFAAFVAIVQASGFGPAPSPALAVGRTGVQIPAQSTRLTSINLDERFVSRG